MESDQSPQANYSCRLSAQKLVCTEALDHYAARDCLYLYLYLYVLLGL